MHLELSKIDFYSIKNEIKKLFEISEERIHICSHFLELKGINNFLPLLSSKAKNEVDIKIISRQIDKTDFQTRFNDIKRIYDFFYINDCLYSD